MAVPSINSSNTASTVGKFTSNHDATTPLKTAGPIFSRAVADQGKMPSLRSLGVEQGKTPSNDEVKRALTGDLLRIVRDLRAGDLPKANAKLHEMKGALPKNFFTDNHIHPLFIAHMGRDMLLAPNAKAALDLVVERLESSGVGKWHPQLGAAATPNKG